MRIVQYFLIFLLLISLGLFAWQVYLYFQPHWRLEMLRLKKGDRDIAYKFGWFIALNIRLILVVIIFSAIRKPLIQALKNKG